MYPKERSHQIKVNMTYICTHAKRFSWIPQLEQFQNGFQLEHLWVIEMKKRREGIQQKRKTEEVENQAHVISEYRVTFTLLLPDSNKDAFVNILTWHWVSNSLTLSCHLFIYATGCGFTWCLPMISRLPSLTSRDWWENPRQRSTVQLSFISNTDHDKYGEKRQ